MAVHTRYTITRLGKKTHNKPERDGKKFGSGQWQWYILKNNQCTSQPTPKDHSRQLMCQSYFCNNIVHNISSKTLYMCISVDIQNLETPSMYTVSIHIISVNTEQFADYSLHSRTRRSHSTLSESAGKKLYFQTHKTKINFNQSDGESIEKQESSSRSDGLLSHQYLLSLIRHDSNWINWFSIIIEYHLMCVFIVIATRPSVL